MNKKTIIQLAIVVVAFGASGLVLYYGYFGGSAPSAISPGPESATSQTQSAAILPFGDKPLNFEVLHKRQDRAIDPSNFDYPKLDPQTQVGVPIQDLVKTPAKQQ